MDDQKTPHDAQAGNEEKTDDTPFARHPNELDDQDTINPDLDESTGSDHIDDIAASVSDDVVQGIFQNEAWWDAQVDSDSPTCCLDGSPPSELASPRDKEPDTYAALLHKQVDNFELLEILGRGGMGVVFRARQLALDRIVCLKMMRLPELANAAEYKRFHAETLAIARLQHPNIVGIHGVGRYQNAPYYSMDYVEGVTLSKVISETPLRAAQAARYLMVIAEAIAYAHKNGIIHRDLKPSNVIIDTLGIPKITDFGIAKHLGAAEDLTTTGQLLGTPPYMSPEQASARHSDVGPSTDVYSLGAILYALLTGRPPHRGDTLMATIKLVQEEPPIAPRVLNRDIPVDLETICLTCLEKAPSARYASVEALAADLRRFLRDEPIEARRPSWLARGWRQIRRHPTVSVLTLACLSLVLLAGAGLVAFSVKQAFWNQEQTELIAALNASLARSLRSEREAQDLRYTSEMKFASQLISNGDYRGAAELLKPYVPEGDDFDFRGLEWYVFQQRAMPAEHANANLEQALFFLTMSIDGRWLAAAGCGDSVFLLNPQTCVVEQRIDTDQLEVNGVGLSSDGGRMGTAGDDGTIKVWSLENRQLLFSISAHDGPAFYAAFIKDDTQIVSCGMDTSLKVWDAANGDLLAELQGHTSRVEAFAISPDGDYLYSISEDDTGAIFNLDSRQLIWREKIHQKRPTGVAYSPDGRLVVTGALSHTLRIRNLEEKTSTTIDLAQPVQSVVFSPDGNYVVAGDRQGMIHVLSVQPADESPTQVDVQMVDGWCAHDGRVYALRFSHDGRYLYTAGSDGLLKCHGFDPTRRTTETAVTSANTRALPLAAAFIPETSRLLVADLGFGISERDCSAELPAHIRTLRLEEPEAVSCSPDGALFAAGSRRGRVVISETETGKLVREMNLELCVDELYFSPDGKMLAILTSPLGTNQRRARVIDVQTGRDVFQVPKVEWRTVAFSPDSRLIYAAEDEVNNVAVWDIANNSRQGTINHHQTTIIQVAVSCDGRYVVSLANNGSFIIRDTKENHQTNLRTGLRGRIETFALGPFGRSLLTVDTNGVVRVCNLPTGHVVCDLATIAGKSPLPILHLSANGKFLALLNERELCISDLLPATDSDDMPSYDTP